MFFGPTILTLSQYGRVQFHVLCFTNGKLETLIDENSLVSSVQQVSVNQFEKWNSKILMTLNLLEF